MDKVSIQSAIKRVHFQNPGGTDRLKIMAIVFDLAEGGQIRLDINAVSGILFAYRANSSASWTNY